MRNSGVKIVLLRGEDFQLVLAKFLEVLTFDYSELKFRKTRICYKLTQSGENYRKVFTSPEMLESCRICILISVLAPVAEDVCFNY